MQRGFSLVELSIVLVILGLLTGGILAGQSLIRAAELRAVSAEYSRYTTAVQTFRDKYMALPGDMREATRFWMRQVNASHCATNTSPATAVGTPGTCDGNGDGDLAGAPALSQSGEFAQFWRQMALAGLIEGTYTGISGSGNAYHMVINENVPPSKLNNAGWSTVMYGSQTAESGLFDGQYNDTFVVGAQATSGGLNNPVLKPEEAWNIDTKMDDGSPANGRVVVRSRVGCALAANGAALTNSAADATKLDSNYNLASSSISCVPVFRSVF